GKGVVPALDFVPREKIHIDLGILVDEHLETSSPGVFAAGDVAQATDVVRHKKWVNAIWPVAAEQGIIAGFNMAGRPVSYRGSLGRNVLRIFRLDVLSGGIIDAPSHSGYRTLTYSNPFKRIYRKIVIKDSIPVGLVMVGDIEQGGIILSLIHRQLPLMVEPELLLDPHFSFSSLLSTASPKRRIIA
ncbi:MAG: FAD-dependent oxidoreductase, partial [Desulfomonilaceae bacterium]